MITVILTLGTTVVAGCESDKDVTNKEKNYDIQQTTPDEQRDQNDDCPDGDCEKKPEDMLPDFKFRIPRTPDNGGIRLPEDKDDCGDRPCPLPRFPRRGRHVNDDTIPTPKPKPIPN